MMEYENNPQQNNGEILRLKNFKLMEELKISLSIPSRLTELGEVTKKTFVKYVIFISLLVSIIIYLIPTIATIAGFGGFHSLFMEKMPAFKYQSGKLVAENKFDMVLSGYHLYIDSWYSSMSCIEKLQKYRFCVTGMISDNRIKLVNFLEKNLEYQ